MYQVVFDEVAEISLKYKLSVRERDNKLQEAKKYEKAYKVEEAAKLYEELEMWNDAGRIRKKLNKQLRFLLI